MKQKQLLTAIFLLLVGATIGGTLYVSAQGGESLMTSVVERFRGAEKDFEYASELNPDAAPGEIKSEPVEGKKDSDMLTAAEFNRVLEMIQSGQIGSGTTEEGDNQIILSKGEKTDPRAGSYGAADRGRDIIISETINVSRSGVLHISGYGDRLFYESYGGTPTEGVELVITVDGYNCSRDNSVKDETTALGFKSSASCIIPVDAGDHTIEVRNNDIIRPEHAPLKGSAPNNTRMQWSVVANTVVGDTGAGGGLGVLSIGEKESTRGGRDNVSITETITIPEDGVLHISGNTKRMYDRNNGVDSSGHVRINVNGVRCGASTHEDADAQSTAFWASASCVKELSAGSHTITVVSVGGGRGNDQAKHEESNMMWVVYGKGDGAGGGSVTPSGPKIYKGIANVTYLNGQAHSSTANVNFAETCTNPVVHVKTETSSILCGNGVGPTVCPNSPGTTSEDLKAYFSDLDENGFKTFLSSSSGVWVGATSPVFNIHWIAACD